MRRRLSLVVLASLMLGACTPSAAHPSGPSADTALDLMFHNEYAAAAAQLKGLIKAHPQDPQPHAAYALLLNYETHQKQALIEAEAAFHLAPSDGYVLTILTRVQDWNNLITQAASTGARAVKTSPNSALAHAFYGEALADTGLYDQAVGELKRAASLAASGGAAYDRAESERNWANYYRDRRDYPNALARLKLAAGDQPGWVERLLELARFAIGRQDLKGATGYLQRAAAISPNDAGLREQLGEVAIFAQDYAVAKDAYRAALRLQPRNTLDLAMLGDIAVALDHDATTAAQDERAAVAAEPTDQQAGAYLVAVLRYLQGDATAAAVAAKNTVAPLGTTPGASTFVDLDQLAQDRQATALAAVNHYRQIAGLPPVGLSGLIHQSSLAHAFYTFFNGASPQIRDLGIHKEVAGGQGYSGDNVLTRAEHFGYTAHTMAEVITHRDDPSGAVTDWVDSIFHRIPILRADLLELGYGDAYLGPMSVQVMDMAYRQARTSNRIVVYPADHQLDVPPAFQGNEIPDPDPNAAYPVGYPITATFDRFAAVKLATWHLRDPAGTDLPGVALTPDNPEMENSFGFLANSPLEGGTTYAMELSGTVNGVPFNRLWHFTTASAPGTPAPIQSAADLIGR